MGVSLKQERAGKQTFVVVGGSEIYIYIYGLCEALHLLGILGVWWFVAGVIRKGIS